MPIITLMLLFTSLSFAQVKKEVTPEEIEKLKKEFIAFKPDMPEVPEIGNLGGAWKCEKIPVDPKEERESYLSKVSYDKKWNGMVKRDKKPEHPAWTLSDFNRFNKSERKGFEGQLIGIEKNKEGTEIIKSVKLLPDGRMLNQITAILKVDDIADLEKGAKVLSTEPCPDDKEAKMVQLLVAFEVCEK